MTLIVAFAGNYGAGKSTTCKTWSECLPNSVVVSYATCIRERIISEGVLTRQEAYGKPTPDFIRKYIQEKGRDYKRENPNFVVEYMDDVIARNAGKTIFIDDLRYKLEWQYLQKYDNVVIWLGNDPDTSTPYDLEFIYGKANLYWKFDFHRGGTSNGDGRRFSNLAGRFKRKVHTPYPRKESWWGSIG